MYTASGEVRRVREDVINYKKDGRDMSFSNWLVKLEGENNDQEFKLTKSQVDNGWPAKFQQLKGKVVSLPVNVFKDQKGYMNYLVRGADFKQIRLLAE